MIKKIFRVSTLYSLKSKSLKSKDVQRKTTFFFKTGSISLKFVIIIWFKKIKKRFSLIIQAWWNTKCLSLDYESQIMNSCLYLSDESLKTHVNSSLFLTLTTRIASLPWKKGNEYWLLGTVHCLLYFQGHQHYREIVSTTALIVKALMAQEIWKGLKLRKAASTILGQWDCPQRYHVSAVHSSSYDLYSRL